MNTYEFEYLALVINYQDLLEKTILIPEYFTNENKVMFDIILKEYQKNRILNFTNLSRYDNFDGNYYIELLDGNIYRTSKNKQFLILENNIIEEYKKRKVLEIIKEYDGKEGIEQLCNSINKIRDLKTEQNYYINVEKILSVLSEQKSQIKLGFSYLDNMLKIEQNDMIIIAGGTGTGKTSFALNLLSNISKKYQCLYFNMEMSEKTLYKRLCSMETGIDITKLNNYQNLSSDELYIINQKISEIGERNIILINNSQNISNVEKIISRVPTDKHLIVFLDHIGLINSKGNGLYEKMTNIAKKLRGLCLDYNCTIFGLCQLSRESQKEDRQPKLQDLRDSGEIEQSARKVMLLHNKDHYTQNKIKNVDLIVAKNDNGSLIIKNFKFDVLKQRFYEENEGEMKYEKDNNDIQRR